MSYLVSRYEPPHQAPWDTLVQASPHATFMLLRGFMDYHAHRFTDYSLLVHDERGHLAAALPANLANGELHSHAGLSYGGLVLRQGLPQAQVLAIFRAVLHYLHQQGIGRLHYKQLPAFYRPEPSFADDYALFRCQALRTRCEPNTVVNLAQPLHMATLRRRGVRKALQAGVSVQPSNELARFWEQVLVPNLAERHGVAPAHSLDEMRLLAARFPQHITLWTAERHGELLAGTVVYTHKGAAHAQYISGTPQGRELGAVDALFAQVLAHHAAFCRYFSFGISTEQQGKVLNQGLQAWKEGFGGQPWPHNVYQIDTANYIFLD